MLKSINDIVDVVKAVLDDNFVHPFTITLVDGSFEKLAEVMGI